MRRFFECKSCRAPGNARAEKPTDRPGKVLAKDNAARASCLDAYFADHIALARQMLVYKRKRLGRNRKFPFDCAKPRMYFQMHFILT